VNTIGVSTQITSLSYFVQFNTFCKMTYSLYNSVLGYSCPFVVSIVDQCINSYIYVLSVNYLNLDSFPNVT